MALSGLLRRSKPRLTEGTLQESTYTEPDPAKIDRDACVIRGVKIIGKSSQRGREYTDAAIAEACPMYEGAEVNVEHPASERDQLKVRPILEGWGRLKNVRAVGGDGAYGDLHYLAHHPHTPLFLERIEKGYPIGLSQNARGKWRTEGGRTIVESIPQVISVDLVRKGATTKTLFESEAMSTTVKAVFEQHKAAAKDKSLVALLEDVAGDPTMAPTEMVAPEADATADESIKEALMASITAKLPELDAAALKKVLNAVGIGDSISKTLAGEGESDATATPADAPADPEKPTLESLQSELRQLRHDNLLRGFMKKHRLDAGVLGPARMTLLQKQRSEAEMQTLLESWPQAVRSRPPAAQLQPLYESQPEAAPRLPGTVEGVRSLLRS